MILGVYLIFLHLYCCLGKFILLFWWPVASQSLSKLLFLIFWDKDWIFIMARWFLDYLFYFFEIKIESFFLFFWYKDWIFISIWHIWLLGLSTPVVPVLLGLFPIWLWHSRLAMPFVSSILVGLVDAVTPTSKLMVQEISWLKEVLQVGVPLLNEVLQVDGTRRFIKSSHFSSLG